MTHSPIKGGLESLHQEKRALITLLKKACLIARKIKKGELYDSLMDNLENLKGDKQWKNI